LGWRDGGKILEGISHGDCCYRNHLLIAQDIKISVPKKLWSSKKKKKKERKRKQSRICAYMLVCARG
jgi:hypothetical protein